ncbi:MAG: hypothetical protein IJ586_06355, partial [Alloprevotella sp.]|nr:hypothetical protein [Alloprevotella sp.]
MKHSIVYNILLRGWLFCLTLCLPTVAWAQDDVSDEESAAMAKTKANAPVWQETDPVGANYLSSRRALVGKNCKINRVVSTVAVGSWTDGMLNVVDEDLDNTASFPAVIGANVGVSPVVGIRDLDNYYAAGTTVG